MRPALEHAIIRRDDRLIRTRRLTLWIAGGATAATLGLAGVLSSAIPGHTATTGSGAQSGQVSSSQPGGTTSGAAGSGDDGGSSDDGSGKSGTSSGHSGKSGKARTHLTTPPQPPAATTAPPVVSSGGS
jgi:hypothetical protein